jgi:hypothetical protein
MARCRAVKTVSDVRSVASPWTYGRPLVLLPQATRLLAVTTAGSPSANFKTNSLTDDLGHTTESVSPVALFGRRSFHEKADRCQELVCFFPVRVFALSMIFCISCYSAKPPLSPSFHPHSFVSDICSVPGGCSRFSRCCYLIIDLSSHRFGESRAPGLSRSHLDSAVKLGCFRIETL